MAKTVKEFFQGRASKAILFSIILVVAGEIVLAWQYNRLIADRLPRIEQQVAEQEERLEQQAAESVVRAFLRARLNGEEQQAVFFLTEGAVQAWQEGSFVLLSDDYTDYEIKDARRVDEMRVQFQVEITQSEGMPSQLEIITARKFPTLGEYFIDFVSIAG